jgi:riboflavin kinase/FMN adenylyltransferase
VVRFDSLEDALRHVDSSAGRVATVGFFDGLHRGHRRIVAELKAWAEDSGCEPAVVTFDRHPQAVLGKGHPPVPVISLRHRLLLLEREGIRTTLVLPFDTELASWTPDEFVRRVFQGALGARRILLGFDGAFGRDRQGNYDYLLGRSRELGIDVRSCPAEHVGGKRVSSTSLRAALHRGDLRGAEELLGRQFSLLGRVVPGARRGQKIGYPTANLDIEESAVLPRGVYFARVFRLEEPSGRIALRPERLLPAVVNVGRCPTFSGEDSRADEDEAFDPRRDKVEVHILDFEGDLYASWLEVFIEKKHRSERRFDSVEALLEQIRADVEARRAAIELGSLGSTLDT